MNNFAKIIEVQAFDKITYYTVKFENNTHGEFEDFIDRYENNSKVKEEFQYLITLIEQLGEKIGAKKQYFRHEQRADALPPPARLIKIDYNNNLRLYCMRLCNSIVILFNGGVKSQGVKTAQECPIVKPYFDQANKLVQKIDELIKDREIEVDDVNQVLIFDDNTEIEL